MAKRQTPEGVNFSTFRVIEPGVYLLPGKALLMSSLHDLLSAIISAFLGVTPSSGEVTTDGSGVFDPWG